jgi:hypothetical protein
MDLGREQLIEIIRNINRDYQESFQAQLGEKWEMESKATHLGKSIVRRKGELWSLSNAIYVAKRKNHSSRLIIKPWGE